MLIVHIRTYHLNHESQLTLSCPQIVFHFNPIAAYNVSTTRANKTLDLSSVFLTAIKEDKHMLFLFESLTLFHVNAQIAWTIFTALCFHWRENPGQKGCGSSQLGCLTMGSRAGRARLCRHQRPLAVKHHQHLAQSRLFLLNQCSGAFYGHADCVVSAFDGYFAG